MFRNSNSCRPSAQMGAAVPATSRGTDPRERAYGDDAPGRYTRWQKRRAEATETIFDPTLVRRAPPNEGRIDLVNDAQLAVISHSLQTGVLAAMQP
ncbi:hypothetical protein [Tessaracoccus sp. Y1736]